MDMFTPNGFSVMVRQRAISLVRSSGVGWVSAVMNPRQPALATAATSSARPTHCMPPWVIGCSTPNVSVKRVFNIFLPPWSTGRHPQRAVKANRLAVDHLILDYRDDEGGVLD